MNHAHQVSHFPLRFRIQDRTLSFIAGSRVGERLPLNALEDAGFLAVAPDHSACALARVLATPDRRLLIADVWEGIVAPEVGFKRAWDAHFRRNFLALGMESVAAERLADLRTETFNRQLKQLKESVSWNAGTRIQSGYLEPLAESMEWIAPRGIKPRLPELTIFPVHQCDIRLTSDMLDSDLRSERIALHDNLSREVIQRLSEMDHACLTKQAVAGALTLARLLVADA